MKNTIRIAIAQINPTVGDFSGNSNKILTFLESANKRQADLVIFPEMVLCGYPPEDLLFKRDFLRENQIWLSRIAKKAKGLAVILGFTDLSQGKVYNAAAFIENGRCVAKYHKMCLPNYGVFDEKRYFSEGTRPLVVQTAWGNIALSICEDIWVLDNPFMRDIAQRPINLLVNLSASPYQFGKLKERHLMVRSRAKKLKSPIVYANIIGGQDELVFDGASFVVSAQGDILAKAHRFHEDLLICDLELRKSGRSRIKPRDKATIVAHVAGEQYLDPAGEIYEALCLGTRDYVTKNHFSKVIIGLSGGIDSSLVAAIAVDAIGAPDVVGITMPSKYSSKGTRNDAKVLAQNLGIECLELPIHGLYEKYLRVLEKFFHRVKPDVTEENLQARIRGNILMAFSNKFKYLVLTTGNKSEIATGYCTLYGDMVGGFAVIKDVPKMRVYQLCRFRNKVAGRDIIPSTVIRRAPSAELRPGQKDSDSLPPYEVLDSILESYIENDMSMARMRKKGIRHRTIDSIVKKVDLNEYKRRQGPIGVKITPKAFGRDRRMPITNRFQRDP